VAKLTITRGLPASGKTTYARNWVAEDRKNRARINRDDLRMMLDEGMYVAGVTEPRIVLARNGAIKALLESGIDVICDDTNLSERRVRELELVAKRAAAGFEIIDFTVVSLGVCLKRDSLREDKRPIGRTVICGMHKRYLKDSVSPEFAELLKKYGASPRLLKGK
jgi:tRNA uridine 5-carbamoylmethylation protein Kti12